MKQQRDRAILLCVLVVAACICMAWVESVLRPVYPIKSALKWVIFGGSMVLYLRLRGHQELAGMLKLPDKRAMRAWAALACLVFCGILGGYALLSPWLDLSAVAGSLKEKEGITAGVFPLAALYITLGNSFLEELFFRGFCFLCLYRLGGGWLAWIFSALAFALYHVTILDGWFGLKLFFLLTTALAGAGLFLNWLDRSGSLWPGWLVHMAANLAINIIGFRLFGLI